MIKDMVLVDAGKGFSYPMVNDVIFWQTCVRTLLIDRSLVTIEHIFDPQRMQIFQGEAAYRYLLEVVCGIHSPLMGETEVLGQFRDRFLAGKNCCPNEHREHRWLDSIVQSILTDAKQIRKRYLQGLGSQSYGSLIRKVLPPSAKVVLLGSGKLAFEILPWLVDQEVTLVCRDPQKVWSQLDGDFKIELKTYNQIDQIQPEPSQKLVLIIAAPVSNDFLAKCRKPSDEVFRHCMRHTVFDLRADSDNSHWSNWHQVYSLQQFFRELASTSDEIKNQIQRAQQAIEKRVEQKKQKLAHRPFGWDDLCA